MECQITLSKEDVEEAIKLWVEEIITGRMYSLLRVDSVRRKSSYEDSFVVELVRPEAKREASNT